MKLHFLPFLAAIKLVNAGWKLDPRTCKGGMQTCLFSGNFNGTLIMKSNSDDADIINNLLTSAFEMAEYGQTAVENILNGKAQSENVDNIVKWMFFKDDEDTRGVFKTHRLQYVKGRCRARL